MSLTNIQVGNAKAGAKPDKLTDSDGMLLLVPPSGATYWTERAQPRLFQRSRQGRPLRRAAFRTPC